MSRTAAAPTLFRVLCQERRWTTWETFAIHFDKAASAAMLDHPLRRPRPVTVARRTFDRWFTGTWCGLPRPDTCRVLEQLFGFAAEELFRPAPAVLRPAAVPAGPEQIRAAQNIEARWATSRLSLTAAAGRGGDTWELDGRRVFDGTSLAVHLLVADFRGSSARLPVTEPEQLKEFLRPVRRGLVLGTHTNDAEHQVFVLDALTARSQLPIEPGADFNLVVPDAHRLDDLTYGIIWAIANTDDALLADDQLIHAEHDALNTYLALPRTAPSRASIPGLTAVGAAWIGSYFCYRHITRHLADASSLPVFWTREQYGESSVGWLLWAHKHQYLREIEDRFATQPGREVSRTFCLPEAAVKESEPYELILLFLSIALMEMHRVKVHISDEPEMTTVDGFVLVPGQRAVIANWVRTEGIWQAATSSSHASMRDYADAAGHAARHSVASGATSPERLQALASYLGLDWAWLTHRCRSLGEQGVARMIRPRSRLIALDELESTLRFVGDLAN
ncbi:MULTISPECIES: transcriptional regulator, XRE family protein [Streptomyces]|uniref:Transcriptional regulator, XRE family protein n=1 Tax=Streptomyces griseiscabiei TaxID=2993540 RepID=A0ABU4LFK5_9ACTN|nr:MULTISPECIES: transcriptional regulator, XRE family protein [Streptomyces]MBZ3908456.1 transcriptional regulator, XRE family protein [Streptomyces griseiscabiei]MDX2913974.1 transcriptional regulator, XRE family protein [Streptomyces griseiscabiei]